MKIGIDARPTQGRFTGDATYWRGLIEGLSRLESDDRFVLYLDARLPDPKIPACASFQLRKLYAPTWRIWSALTFPSAMREDGVQIAHVQYTIPPLMPCPVITSIHDISFKRHPEFFRLQNRLILDMGVRYSAKKAARILAISECTKKEILSLYHMPESRVDIVYPGVDAQFVPIDREAARATVRKKYGISQPFVLTVGVIQPRKNLPRLLEGFAQFKLQHESDHKLVIVGKYGWKESNLLRRIDELGIGDEVIITGYAPYGDLPLFYNAADVFVYPSVYEGFGLPPLEAMACGTPVITGNRSSLPEVVGEAGIMVDPYDPDAFADAVWKVSSSESLREEMSANGLIQAQKFSWDAMARRMLEIYHAVRP